MVFQKLNFYLLLCLLFFTSHYAHSYEAREINLEMAIDKLISYFESKLDSPDIANKDYKEVYSILPVLCREYGYKFNYSDKYLDSALCLNEKHFSLKSNSFMNRTISHNILKSQWQDNRDNIDTRTNVAMYCKDFKLKNKDYNLMMTYRNINLYELTHTAFQFYFIEKNECLNFHYLEEMKSVLIEEIEYYLQNKDWKSQDLYASYTLDIELELKLALLLLSRNIDCNLSSSVLKHQLEDGGFSMYEEGKKSSLHSSLIAFWLLSHSSSIIKKR